MIEDKNFEGVLNEYKKRNIGDLIYQSLYFVPVVNIVVMLKDLATWSFDEANANVRKHIADQLFDDRKKALW